jgi:hypothetical protein
MRIEPSAFYAASSSTTYLPPALAGSKSLSETMTASQSWIEATCLVAKSKGDSVIFYERELVVLPRTILETAAIRMSRGCEVQQLTHDIHDLGVWTLSETGLRQRRKSTTASP